MFSLFSISFQEKISLCDCIGLRVDFLAEEMNGYFLASLLRKMQQSVLGNCKNTSCSACSVIAGIRGIFYLVCNRNEDKIRHEFNDIPRRPVLSSFLVVVFVEAPDQLLKYCTHAMIVQGWMLENLFILILVNRIWRQVYIRGDELLDYSTKNVSIDHCGYLAAELELLQDVLDIRGEPIKISFEISFQRLLLRSAGKILQKKR